MKSNMGVENVLKCETSMSSWEISDTLYHNLIIMILNVIKLEKYLYYLNKRNLKNIIHLKLKIFCSFSLPSFGTGYLL